MRRKCYISGPITGLEPVVYLLAFYRGAKYAESMGYAAINPCDLNHADHDQSWESFMKLDIKALMDCDAICLLPNWHQSVGAKTEYHLAQVLGMDVLIHADGADVLVESAMNADIIPN